MIKVTVKESSEFAHAAVSREWDHGLRHAVEKRCRYRRVSALESLAEHVRRIVETFTTAHHHRSNHYFICNEMECKSEKTVLRNDEHLSS